MKRKTLEKILKSMKYLKHPENANVYGCSKQMFYLFPDWVVVHDLVKHTQVIVNYNEIIYAKDTKELFFVCNIEHGNKSKLVEFLCSRGYISNSCGNVYTGRIGTYKLYENFVKITPKGNESIIVEYDKLIINEHGLMYQRGDTDTYSQFGGERYVR